MKKDKEWLQGKVSEAEEKTTKKAMWEYTLGYNQALVDVDKLIDQLDEPEKVTIPQFVADWWECDGDSVAMYGGLRVEKKHKFDLVSSFHDKGLGDYFSKVEDWLDENNSIFLDLVNGKPYEIEKEKKHYVLNKDGESILRRQLNGEISTSMGIDVKTSSTPENYQFTIEEIKKYDERYMPFAVEVDNE